MTSAKEDVESLMNEYVAFAEQLLSKYGEFAPYGAAMKSDGETVSVSGFDEDQNTVPTNIIELLTDAFTTAAHSRTYRATAMFYNATVELPESSEQLNVVACALDHEDNFSVIVLLPYELTESDVIFGEPIAQEGESQIFGRVH